jgi:hypothetical protein
MQHWASKYILNRDIDKRTLNCILCRIMTINAASCLHKFGTRSSVLASQRHSSSSSLNLSINWLLLYEFNVH